MFVCVYTHTCSCCVRTMYLHYCCVSCLGGSFALVLLVEAYYRFDEFSNDL